MGFIPVIWNIPRSLLLSMNRIAAKHEGVLQHILENTLVRREGYGHVLAIDSWIFLQQI